MECNAVIYGQNNCLNSGKYADIKKIGSAVLMKVHTVAVSTLQNIQREPSSVAFNMEVLFLGAIFFFFQKILNRGKLQ